MAWICRKQFFIIKLDLHTVPGNETISATSERLIKNEHCSHLSCSVAQQRHMRSPRNNPSAVSDHLHPFPLASGRQRLLYQLAGVVPSPLLLELLSCPLCARSLETLELELGDLEGGRGEADGLHDFPQVRMGDNALMMLVNRDDKGCGSGDLALMMVMMTVE